MDKEPLPDRLKELKVLNDRLTVLLDDPHPGMASWCMAYGEVMSAISRFWRAAPTAVGLNY